MRGSSSSGAFAFAFAFALSGCGAAVRSAAREAPRVAVPIAIDESIRSLEDPETRARVERLLATPELQAAIEHVAAAALSGAAARASTEDEEARMEKLMARITKAMSLAIREIAAEHGDDLARARQAIREDASSIAEKATQSALQSASREIPETLAPALRKALVTELQSPDLHDALAKLVRDMTQEALAASRESVAAAQHRREAEGRTPIVHGLENLVALSWGLAAVVGGVAIGLLAWSLRMRRRNKRYKTVIHRVLAREEKNGDRSLRELLDTLAV